MTDIALSKFKLGTLDLHVAEDKNGARQWVSTPIPMQDAEPDKEVEIVLDDFTQGYGTTFENIPSAYAWADGWDARTPGRLTTWPVYCTTEVFTSLDRRGWQFQNGNYMYIARGRYVVKYLIDPTRGAVWPILEIHDLGANCFAAGRPDQFNGAWYVPIVNTSGVRQKFHELTTTVTDVVEQQTVTVTGTPTAGSYVLHWQGLDTAAIAFNAAAAAVQAALRLVPGLEKVTVSDTGTTPNFVHTVTMTGAAGSFANSVAQMTVTDNTSGGTHNIAIATTVAGTVDTWTQGPANREMQCFRRWKNLLAGAKGNKLYTVAADPLVDGDWAPADGAGYDAGDPGYDIKDLAVWLNLIACMKPDGLFTFDDQFNSVNELVDLALLVDTDNGIGTEYSNGFLLIPHANGLKRWTEGAYEDVGPQKEGFFEGDIDTPGWGRIISMVTAGRDAYFAMLNGYTAKGTMGSLLVPLANTDRQPLIPHMHDSYAGKAENVAIVTRQFASGTPDDLTTASDDNAVGTITWAIPGNAIGSDDVYATALAGTSHYLKLLDKATAVPSEATILGVQVDIERSVGV